MPGQGAADKIARDSESGHGRLVTLAVSPPREYSLNKPTVAIGSHPSNDVVLDDTTVSRRHATITRKEGGYELADLGSTNGTYVNGRRGAQADSAHERRRDQIRLCAYGFQSVVGTAPDVAGIAFLWPRCFSWASRRPVSGRIYYRHYRRISHRLLRARSSSAPSPVNTQSAAGSSTAAAASSVPAPATAAALEPEWLKRVNYYRAMVKLAPIVEDPALSAGDRAHTMYIVRNYHDRIEGGGLGAEMHTEDPGSPGFTPEGLDAAKTSDMDVWSMRGVAPASDAADPDPWGSPAWSIDGWMSLPFHRMPILNPQLDQCGLWNLLRGRGLRGRTQPLERRAADGRRRVRLRPGRSHFLRTVRRYRCCRSKTNGLIRSRVARVTRSRVD